MNSAYLKIQMQKLTKYLALKTEMVQHRDVIREVALSADRSWVYYLTLILASLIALLGLLTNSVAVVIGAMLISPLMGPIISSSLAFTIGDLPLARRAFQTIAISVALTILVSAAISFISPLKEPTAEILARVRPNIFDLFVAVLSGVVGAIALCTKRNYLITSTGVAVATAVIPPLSVTGYGLGTGQPMLALGGFLLFFTNFVAIILASDLVFFILGFRTSHVETVQYSRRMRLGIVGGLLTLISIPLVYTLVADLTKVKEQKRIERVLKRHLDQAQASRLTGYQQQSQGKRLLINASVNTVRFVDRESEQLMERELTRDLQRPVDIRLEQILVASGETLKRQGASELLTGALPPAPRPESPAELGGRVGLLAAQVESELAGALAPFALTGTRLTFSGGQPLLVSASLRRDYPLSEDERLILSRQIERVLSMPVTLAIATTRLLPELLVDRDGTLAPDSARELEIVKRLPDGPERFRFQISAPGKNSSEAKAIGHYLTRELAVPERLLSLARISARSTPGAGVTLRIVRR